MNVIEELIEEFSSYVEGVNRSSASVEELVEARTYRSVIAAIRAATDCRQFMPPEREWPEDAVAVELAVGVTAGSPLDCWFQFIDEDGYTVTCGEAEQFEIQIPCGVDPRIRVSRAAMREHEKENGDE